MEERTHSNLRLVRPTASSTQRWRLNREAQRDIARENRLAALNAGRGGAVDPTDPRWVLAARARSQMQGAILTPDRREKLLKLGTQLGLGRFESNVIVAMIQNEAREALPRETLAQRLKTVNVPSRRDEGRAGYTLRWVAALISAIAGTAFLVWWLLG